MPWAIRSRLPTVPGEPPSGFFAVKADVTDPDSLDAAFAAIEAHQGPVEVLVANAGITHDTLLLRMSDDDFDSVVQTNLVGSFRVAKRAAKGMLRLKRGRLIFMSSVVALLGFCRADQLCGGQGGHGRVRALGRARAGFARDHRQRDRSGVCRHRHDCRIV